MNLVISIDPHLLNFKYIYIIPAKVSLTNHERVETKQSAYQQSEAKNAEKKPRAGKGFEAQMQKE